MITSASQLRLRDSLKTQKHYILCRFPKLTRLPSSDTGSNTAGKPRIFVIEHRFPSDSVTFVDHGLASRSSYIMNPYTTVKKIFLRKTDANCR